MQLSTLTILPLKESAHSEETLFLPFLPRLVTVLKPIFWKDGSFNNRRIEAFYDYKPFLPQEKNELTKSEYIGIF